MVTINLAYTAPINPAGATPTLTPPQVWAGLQRKVRAAHEFVPLISACTVLSESEAGAEGNHTITREVVFKSQPDKPVREECVHYAPCRVDFRQEDGSTISNVVSRDPQGGLVMTYVFEWRHPGVSGESAGEVEGLREGHWKVSKSFPRGCVGRALVGVRSGV